MTPKWLAVLQIHHVGLHFYAFAPGLPSPWNAILLSFVCQENSYSAEKKPSSGIVFSNRSHCTLLCGKSPSLLREVWTHKYFYCYHVTLPSIRLIHLRTRAALIHQCISVPKAVSVWWLKEVLGSLLAGGIAHNGKMVISCFLSPPQTHMLEFAYVVSLCTEVLTPL